MNDGADFLELAVRDGHALSGKSLAELETVIERGQQTFIEVGRALLEIRDGRLYRDSHATFEAYCRERWGWGRTRAYQLMDGAAVAGALSTAVDKPESEREARAMLASLRPEEREQVRVGTASQYIAQKMAQPIRRPKNGIPDGLPVGNDCVSLAKVRQLAAHEFNNLVVFTRRLCLSGRPMVLRSFAFSFSRSSRASRMARASVGVKGGVPFSSRDEKLSLPLPNRSPDSATTARARLYVVA